MMGLVDIIVKLHHMQQTHVFELYSNCPRCIHLNLHYIISIKTPIFRANKLDKIAGVESLDVTTSASVGYDPKSVIHMRRLINRECRACAYCWQEIYEPPLTNRLLSNK